jgi:hypothetical protein
VLRRSAWLAVRTTDAQALVAELRLRTVLPMAADEGFAAAARAGTFVPPPGHEWLVVVGADVAAATADPAARERLLLRLQGRFGAAAWFCCDDDGERHGWALADGDGVRAYAFDGELGVVQSVGDVTADERDLGCHVPDPRDQSDDEDKWFPDRRTVFALAARWTVDPVAVLAGAGDRTGWFGRL